MKSTDREMEERKNAAAEQSLTGRLKSEILEIENRIDLSTEDKISRITHIACAACAAVAVQPIPFADIFILTPIQAYMGSRIAAIRGVPISESDSLQVIKEIIGAIGMGFIAQQLALSIWKTLIPGAGGFMTIPIVYSLSYAIMRVMDAYFCAKAKNQNLSKDQIKELWKRAAEEGKERANETHDVVINNTDPNRDNLYTNSGSTASCNTQDKKHFNARYKSQTESSQVNLDYTSVNSKPKTESNKTPNPMQRVRLIRALNRECEINGWFINNLATKENYLAISRIADLTLSGELESSSLLAEIKTCLNEVGLKNIVSCSIGKLAPEKPLVLPKKLSLAEYRALLKEQRLKEGYRF